MHRILVVDDDPIIMKVMKYILNDEGYDVTTQQSSISALEMLRYEVFDLIILDTHMSGIDGLEMCRQIRVNSSTPIIFVSASGTVHDKVAGLRGGADDYIAKPFDPNELLARVWATLRRNRQLANSESHLRTPDLVLNPLDNQVTLAHQGRTVPLTPIEARLLLALVSNPGRTITRDTLIARVWNYEYDGGSNQLDVYIKRLRGKIEVNPSEPQLLLTVRGVGYKYLPSTHTRTQKDEHSVFQLAAHA